VFLTSGQETYRAGEVIYKEGSHGRSVYIMSSGRVEISKVARGKKVIIETLGPGAIFGMMALIDPSPRSATVIALEDTVVDLADKGFLDREFNQLTSDFRQLLVTLVRRLKKTTDDFVDASSRLETKVTGTVRISFKRESDFFKAYIANLAKGGLFVKTMKILPVDTFLNVEFSLPNRNQMIHTTGKVVWTRSKDKSSEKMPPGMGIQFVDIDPEDERLLKNYMAAFQSS
jgi:CRP/FNR family cyclic AMP-dependent transcriptional regulator